MLYFRIPELCPNRQLVDHDWSPSEFRVSVSERNTDFLKMPSAHVQMLPRRQFLQPPSGFLRHASDRRGGRWSELLHSQATRFRIGQSCLCIGRWNIDSFKRLSWRSLVINNDEKSSSFSCSIKVIANLYSVNLSIRRFRCMTTWRQATGGTTHTISCCWLSSQSLLWSLWLFSS